jgi:iduronate 2-sulfatase
VKRGKTAQRPNVLFICIDDLRPDLNCYGNPVIHSPNLDRLAKQSALFMRQYVTQPTCGASRYSLLTGRLPRNAVEISNEALEKQVSGKPRTEVPETFIDNLRRNGYYTVGMGKISHSPDGYVYGYDDPKAISWNCRIAGTKCCSIRVNGKRAGMLFLATPTVPIVRVGKRK